MKESQYIRGWLNEGEAAGTVKRARMYLLEAVRLRFQDPVPEPVRLAIEGTNDLSTLDRWFKAALQAPSWVDFRATMRLES